ncbi:sensor histidine kinase [Flexithrix dorotheae]|uniref:sensor histidine kinase n=1 Tax=Flexithrix dorotheae TaxID=70993 RepID=UPI000382DD7A|nr:sensor histidine kinase [Flexithrix dorotheae]
MKVIFKYYKAAGIALLITIAGTFVLAELQLILIDKKEILENTLIFLFWWIALSFLIYQLFRKRSKRFILKGTVLLVIAGLAIIVDSFWRIPDNPVTIPLIILFWLGVLELILPGFFKKYRLPILSVYGLITIYFVFARLGYSSSYFENHKERVINFLLIPIPFLIGLYLFEQWKWVKSLQTEKTNTELSLLKSQINPHFFFNTLNNLYGLTVEKSDQAPEVVLKLSDMMRYTIYEGKEDFVLLKNEVTYLENYVELHKLRFHHEVDIRFEQSIRKEIKVAPLLFIILLENAFKHGAESLTKGVFIQIELKTEGDKILFSIENNFDSKAEVNPKGIGLENLKRRLKLTYPEKHKFLMKKRNGIFKATLELPVV